MRCASRTLVRQSLVYGMVYRRSRSLIRVACLLYTRLAIRQDRVHGTATQLGWFGARSQEWLSKNLTTLRDLVMLAVVSVPATAVPTRVSVAAIVTAIL